MDRFLPPSVLRRPVSFESPGVPGGFFPNTSCVVPPSGAASILPESFRVSQGYDGGAGTTIG